jgi:Putative phage tail protein/GTA TIM-barrel-like domain
MQARHRQVLRDAFDWTKPGYVTGLNPVSTVTAERMVDLDHIHVYCWDARPYPAFPYAATYWGDTANWPYGQWLNGRLGGAALDEVVSTILLDQGFTEFDVSGLTGAVPGYVTDRTMAARDAIQPLELAYFFASIESSGKIVFRHRGRADAAMTLGPDDFVESGDALYELTRAQETDLPAFAKVRYISSVDDYPQAVAAALRLTSASGRVAEADLPIVLDDGLAGTIVESWLYETWATRESATFKLPPSTLALEPGDIVSANIGGRSRLLRLTDVSEHGVRDIQALSIDPSVYDQIDVPPRTPSQPAPVQIGSPAVALMDLPQWNATVDAQSGYAAAMQKPWPGSVAVFSSPQDTGYQLKAIAGAPATLGVILDELPSGPEGRLDYRASFRVRLTNGSRASVDLVSMPGGANLMALRNTDGGWEIIQF